MKPVFADSFYYLAILNADDSAHAQAVSVSATLSGNVVTTAWVLTEVADALTGDDHFEQAGFRAPDRKTVV